MSILSVVERAFVVLVRLLSHEASKNRKRADHLDQKRNNHYSAEWKAIENMRRHGKVYRDSLLNKADVHERIADRASALAGKIGRLLE